MTSRTLVVLAFTFLALAASVTTQTQTVPGAAVPGPAPQRPQAPTTPPRDGTPATAPTGTGRIRGRVVSADTGRPLARAQVRLTGLPLSNQPSQVPMSRQANTDADGRYEFLDLPVARYSIAVSRAGYVNLQFGQQRPFEPGKPLTLADGEAADKIDFALPRGGVIAGKVTDEVGDPLPGVRMQAQRYQYMPGGQRRLVMGNSGPGPFNIVTDDLGQFRVYGLMPGSYVLSAIPAMTGTVMMTTETGGVSLSTSRGPEVNDGYATTYFPGTVNMDEAQTITVGLGQETSAYFSIASARMARVSGVIRTSQGTRFTGRMMVSLRTSVGNGGYSTNGMNQIGPDGTFTMANVPPGEHFIDVRPFPGSPSAPGAAPQQVDEEFASVPLTVSGQDISGLVITTGPGATVSGRLIFDGNSPRPKTPQPLRVSVSPADFSNPSPMIMMMGTQDNGVVDESGQFLIRGVNGQVLFRTGAQGWNLKSVTLNGTDITDTPFEAKPSTNVSGLEVVLTDRQTSLSGFVKNSRGDVLKDFVVAIFPAQPKDGAASMRFTRIVRPDQEGKYQARGMPPGDYVAVAVETLEQGGEWDPAFQQAMKPRGKAFRLSDGQLTTLDLALAQ